LVYFVERTNRLGNLGLSSPFGSRGMNARVKSFSTLAEVGE